MRTVLTALCVLAALCLAPLSASAQDEQEPAPLPEQFISIDDMLIEGSTRTPSGLLEMRRIKSEFRSGVELHKSFLPENVRDAKQVR